ncbi:MAG: DNA translocase FtsK 4TM domain-containing protein [Candidatus Brocadiia bacterium]|jgi:S-DNA-T family DNA segregation ATPase FtsK/SpoIIIE
MDRRKIYLRGLGVALVALALILLMSFISYNRSDYPYPVVAPVNTTPENICGTVGAHLAWLFWFFFGMGAILLVFATAVVGGLMIIAQPVTDPVVRGLGAGLFLLAWCGLASRIFDPKAMPGGAGGIIGHFLAEVLLKPLGLGGYVAALAGLVLGALLAADAWVLWLGRKGVEMVTMHGGAAASSGATTAENSAEATASKLSAEERIAEQKESLRKRLAERKTAPALEPAATDSEERSAGKPLPTPASEAPTVVLREKEPRKPVPQAAPEKPPRSKEAARKEPETAGDYRMPGLEVLDPPQPADASAPDEDVEGKREVLERTLEEFGIVAQVVEVDPGPVITQFELELAAGIKIGKIIGLSDDIARALKAQSVRVVAPIPGKSTVGIEVPNNTRQVVRLRELFESGIMQRKRMTIPLLLGKDASGEPLLADLAQMPHLLIAGATGSGKSVCMNSIIMTFLMTQSPEDVKLILIDPKMVELSAFRDIPHLMTPVLTDMKKASAVLEWATHKMDERYSLLANVGVRNIGAYNALGEKEIRKRLDVGPEDDLEGVAFHLPHIIIIIDELADLMMVSAKDVENTITRLAQKSRAVGIHLIVATQRPSVDVVTGLIKANLPSRLAFQTASKVDSRTILDRNGAEKLLGRGDMLFLPPGSAKLIRGQGAFTSDEEIRRVTTLIAQRAKPHYDAELANPQGLQEGEGAAQDPLFDDAVRIILESQRGSVSLLQRKLGIGYGRASRLVDLMAAAGIVGEYKGSQAREVLFTLEDWDAQHGTSGGQNGEG